MKGLRLVVVALTLVWLVPACSGASNSGDGSQPESSERRDFDLLTQEEMLQTNAPSVLEAVRRLRPGWLRIRGMSGEAQTGIQVIVDGQHIGNTIYLETLRPINVAQARWIAGRDATTRWGTNFRDGAIEITTSR